MADFDFVRKNFYLAQREGIRKELFETSWRTFEIYGSEPKFELKKLRWNDQLFSVKRCSELEN